MIASLFRFNSVTLVNVRIDVYVKCNIIDGTVKCLFEFIQNSMVNCQNLFVLITL